MTTADDRRDEHLIFDTMRRYPDGEVRVYSETGKLIAGTWCYQATNDLDRLAAEVVSLRGQITAATSDERLDEAVDWWFGARSPGVADALLVEWRRRMRNAVEAALGGAR